MLGKGVNMFALKEYDLDTEKLISVSWMKFKNKEMAIEKAIKISENGHDRDICVTCISFDDEGFIEEDVVWKLKA